MIFGMCNIDREKIDRMYGRDTKILEGVLQKLITSRLEEGGCKNITVSTCIKEFKSWIDHYYLEIRVQADGKTVIEETGLSKRVNAYIEAERITNINFLKSRPTFTDKEVEHLRISLELLLQNEDDPLRQTDIQAIRYTLDEGYVRDMAHEYQLNVIWWIKELCGEYCSVPDLMYVLELVKNVEIATLAFKIEYWWLDDYKQILQEFLNKVGDMNNE